MSAISDLVYGKMGPSPLLVLSEGEVAKIAQQVHTPEEIAAALWDYAFLCWRRGQRFERSLAADRAMRWWTPRWPWGGG